VADPNPYPLDPGALAATSSDTESSATTTAVYATDQIKIGRYFELLGGVRFDDFRARQSQSTITNATGAETVPTGLASRSDFFSWRAGAVVHPLPNTSIYAVYGTSANPPGEFTTISNGQQTLEPVENESYEIGAKADILDGRLSLTGAVFRINKKNDVENLGTSADPDYQLVGQTRVQGFEVGVAGRITRDWSVFAGYTYLDGHVIESVASPANVGNWTAQTPENSFSLFTTYDITPKWTIGGGAYFVDARFNNSSNSSIVPSFWRFDAVAIYRVTDDLSLQLNVYNLADTTNYESAAGAGWAVPGPGRYATLSARMRF
jgi:catecholate siderophore receptor